MAEAITADILEGQKELIKKVTFIGNVLNKNIVPKSKQKEKDTEDNAWKKKLFGFMSGFKDQFEGMTDAFKTRAKAAGGGLLSMLKKGALLMAIPAILALLNSDIWTSIKDWFVNDLMPALEKMWVSLKALWVRLKPHLEALVKWAKETALPFIMATIVAAFVAVTALLDDITAALSGEKGWVSVLTENKAALAAIALLLFPKTAFALVKAAARGLGSALTSLMTKVLWPMAKDLAVALYTKVVAAASSLRKGLIALNTSIIAPMIKSLALKGLWLVRWAAAGLRTALIALNASIIVEMTKSLAVKGLKYIVWAAQGLRAAIIAMNAAILAPMLVALGPALIVAAPFIAIAAAVALAIKSLYDAFVDAKAIFDDTGDIWLALSEGLSSFLATFMGFIPDMVKNIVAWGLDKLGFTAAAEWLRSFSIVDSLKGIFRNMFDGVFKWLGIFLGGGIDIAVKIWDFVKGLPGKVWDWLKTTVMGWFGMTKEDDDLTGTADETTKPEKGWLSTLFSKIFPKWLTSPVAWAMEKLGLTDASGALTDKGSALSEKVKTGGISGLIGDLFKKIFPEWLTSPVSWAMKKLGLKDDSGNLTDKGSTLSEAVKTGGLGALIGGLFAKIFPEWITSPIKWIKEKIFGKEEKLTDTTADSFFSDWKLPSWESFKEMMPDWLKDPVGWVTGLFKRGKKAGFEEKQKILQEEMKAEAAEVEEKTGLNKDQAIAKYTKLKEAGEFDTKNQEHQDLARQAIDAVQWYSRQAKKQGLMTEGSLDSSTRQFKHRMADDISGMTPEMAKALQFSLDKRGQITERKFQTQGDQDALTKMAEEATDPNANSLYVHDTHVEKSLQQLIQPMLNLAAAQSALLAAYGNGGGSGGSTTVNNVTVSPSTSNTVSSTQKQENVYGVVDPYTSVAGAYG